jgi:hypothetical protein
MILNYFKDEIYSGFFNYFIQKIRLLIFNFSHLVLVLNSIKRSYGLTTKIFSQNTKFFSSTTKNFFLQFLHIGKLIKWTKLTSSLLMKKIPKNFFLKGSTGPELYS